MNFLGYVKQMLGYGPPQSSYAPETRPEITIIGRYELDTLEVIVNNGGKSHSNILHLMHPTIVEILMQDAAAKAAAGNEPVERAV